jgi:fructoselysine 6-kinase
MKVAAVGYSCMDVYENLNESYPTGNGVDFVLNLAKYGIQSSVVSVVGTDEYGKSMIQTLSKRNVDTSHLRVMNGETAVIKMSLIDNDRVHGDETEGVMANFSLTEDDFEFIKKHHYIHTDLFGRVYGLLPIFRDAGCEVIFDFSTYLDDKDLFHILPNVDYAFFSYTQHDSYIESFLKDVKKAGTKIATATLGENGSISYDGIKFYNHGIVPVNVVNTVGAGDAYIAGFMYGIMNGKSIPECQKSGAELSSKIIQNFEPYEK